MQRVQNMLKIYNKNKNFIPKTPLEYNERLSNIYSANIFLKREDLQKTRSFKIRGAYNKILNLNEHDKLKGIACASAGNHAQGVALSCNYLNINADIFVPENTPIQKIRSIKKYLGTKCNLHVKGINFDDSLKYSLDFVKIHNKTFVHPFDDNCIINGQSTIAAEIFEDIKPDLILGCIGGGGLISGISYLSKNLNKNCKIYGVETDTCNAMYKSINSNNIIELPEYDNFVDGAAVKKVGYKTFKICKKYLDNILLVSNGNLCKTMLELYSEDGIIVEPAGALSVCGLEKINKNIIKNKNVVAVISGGNNDISRYPEIQDMALKYMNLKHYFIIEFTQKPGELKKFVNTILNKNDDITRFEYIKKTNKSYGQVLLGIELNDKLDINNIKLQLSLNKFKYLHLNDDDLLMSYLV